MDDTLKCTTSVIEKKNDHQCLTDTFSRRAHCQLDLDADQTVPVIGFFLYLMWASSFEPFPYLEMKFHLSSDGNLGLMQTKQPANKLIPVLSIIGFFLVDDKDLM